MKTLVISSKPSRSATALARALGIRKLATTGRRLTRPLRLLNWGCGLANLGSRGYIERMPVGVHGVAATAEFLNDPTKVSVATNKLLTFQALAEHPDIPIPEFTEDAGTLEVIEEKWVARHMLTGHSGEGIEIFNTTEGVPDAPLYVKYEKKKHEYRVHVILGEANTVQDSTVQEVHTDVQQKRKRQETSNEEVDYQVRNHENGWVYCREELVIPEGIEDLAVRTVRALGLDFGAVDIIWNQAHNKLTVLEVNTAPGLEGQTLEFYERHLRDLI